VKLDMEKILNPLNWLPLVVHTAIVIFAGWVLSQLWVWFVVPFGIQPIHTAWGTGLIILASIFSSPKIPKDDESVWELQIFNFLSVCIALLGGWIAQMFM